MPFLNALLLFLVLTALVIISIATKKLTIAAGITGGVTAILIFAGAGYTGIAMLGAFFITATLATMWKREKKPPLDITHDHSTKRNTSQVLANGAAAAIAGLLIYFIPSETVLLRLMMAASLASATADTLSSELGMVYGKLFYNIITLKPDKKGLDGVVSLEGTLIGVVGAVLIAVIYASGFGWDKRFLFVVIAGTIGNFSDSVLGALFERKKYLNNDIVNLLNTIIAALVAWLLVLFF